MPRIFVLGTGPLLASGSRIMSGQCLRTWHFTKPLLEAGHQVRLLTVPIPGTTGEPGDPPIKLAAYEGFDHAAFTANDEGSVLPLLREEIDAFKPDLLLGINAWPAFLLARLGSPIPFWADLNGWTMAEGLARGAVLGSDEDFGHFWRLEALTILAADRFSTVTERQLYALQGEMAMLGAIDRHRVTSPIGAVVANAIHPLFASLERTAIPPPWLGLDDKARVCLWSGGFNSWTDVPALVLGLEKVLREDPHFHLVCTGGAIHGHDEKTWEDFKEAVENSLPPGRVHLLGWIELEKVLELHAGAALGINIDGINIETRFGARNRLTNMMGAGLPVLTTEGTEIAAWITRHDLGTVIPPGDPLALANALMAHGTQSGAMEERAATARKVALEEFSATNTMKPVLEWIDSGGPPDPRKNTDAGNALTPQGRLATWIRDQCESHQPFSGDLTEKQQPTGIVKRLKRYLKP